MPPRRWRPHARPQAVPARGERRKACGTRRFEACGMRAQNACRLAMLRRCGQINAMRDPTPPPRAVDKEARNVRKQPFSSERVHQKERFQVARIVLRDFRTKRRTRPDRPLQKYILEGLDEHLISGMPLCRSRWRHREPWRSRGLQQLPPAFQNTRAMGPERF